MVNPLLTNTLCVDQPPDPIEQEIPDLYPSCAVTRAISKKAKQNDGKQDIDSAGEPKKGTLSFISVSLRCIQCFMTVWMGFID